jgi:ATP phosphoribosyltransferase
MDRPLTIALPKGRLLPDCQELFAGVGLTPLEAFSTTRRLVVSSVDGSARFIVVRDKDLPTYVAWGAADLGVAGKDVLMEAEKDLLEPLDLLFGSCRLMVARPAEFPEDRTGWGHLRVATRYPNVTLRHFAARGEQVEIIPLHGSIELAPLVGLADRIVDLVSTGETLRQNALVEVEEVARITARLVVNRAAASVRQERILPLVERLGKAVKR